jgi:hypothetical protein
MLTAAARRRVAALRQPRPAARLALTLWIVWAIAVWNVVFDRTIVVAGRQMRPAIAHGAWLASAAGGAIAAAGILLVRAAARASARHDPDRQVTSCA